jgi:hypothetical protein
MDLGFPLKDTMGKYIPGFLKYNDGTVRRPALMYS